MREAKNAEVECGSSSMFTLLTYCRARGRLGKSHVTSLTFRCNKDLTYVTIVDLLSPRNLSFWCVSFIAFDFLTKNRTLIVLN